MQTALITGATSGIGYELAKLMAARGHDLVLASRDLSKLDKVKKELSATKDSTVNTVAVDLSETGSAQKLYEACREYHVEILVNNAGVGLVGDFFDESNEQNASMIQLNCTSLMELTNLFGKDFKSLGKGRILNIASITAFFPGPKQPVYYATKSFVRSFSRALAYSLRDSGVSVTVLHPGVTRTNFFKAARAAQVTQGTSARVVAEVGYKAMMRGDIEVTVGLRNKLLTNVFARFVPYRLQPVIVDHASEV